MTIHITPDVVGCVVTNVTGHILHIWVNFRSCCVRNVLA